MVREWGNGREDFNTYSGLTNHSDSPWTIDLPTKTMVINILKQILNIINKKTGLKVACFKSFDENEPEFSFWNSIDLRVDSLESGLPNDILNLIVKDITENRLPNVSYLNLEQRIKEESLFSKFIKDVSRYDEHEVPQPTMRVVEDVNPDELQEIFTGPSWA